VLSLAWRQELAALVRRHGLLVIEDAPYAFLEASPPLPMAALVPEATVYVSGVSKSIATGLRVGFVAAPPQWVAGIERAIRATTWNTPGVMTAIACGWLQDGTALRLEAEKRQDARRRQRIAAEVLQGLDRVAHPASYFVWLRLQEEVRAEAVAGALMKRRISVSTAEPFATGAAAPHAIRFALGSVDLPTLRASLGTVRSVIDELGY
jgi:DNA-binding transcriptional MocR family regulator